MTSRIDTSPSRVWLDPDHYLEPLPDGRRPFGAVTVVDTAGRTWRVRRSHNLWAFAAILLIAAVALIAAALLL